jgi:Low-density lipoprotein receptor domain class A
MVQFFSCLLHDVLVAEAACPTGQWQCNNTRCIPAAWHCDGSFDCKDHSDEMNCPRNGSKTNQRLVGISMCNSEHEFQCRSTGECIHRKWVCDVGRDCEDGSDEEECNYTVLLYFFIFIELG